MTTEIRLLWSMWVCMTLVEVGLHGSANDSSVLRDSHFGYSIYNAPGNINISLHGPAEEFPLDVPFYFVRDDASKCHTISRSLTLADSSMKEKKNT